MKLLALFLIFHVLISKAEASTEAQKRDMSEKCLAHLPSDWGPNFDASWRANEAKYWACVLGEQIGLVSQWQSAANLSGVIQHIREVVLGGKRLVILQEVEGSASCSSFKVLETRDHKWYLSSGIEGHEDEFCTFACPAIKMTVVGHDLKLKIPGGASPNEDIHNSCKHPVWTWQKYHWDGKIFAPMPSEKIDRNRP